MASNLVKKVIQRTALFTSLIVGTAGFGSGCSSGEFYHEASPIFNLMPRVIQPGGHRDYVEKRERELKEERNQVNMYDERAQKEIVTTYKIVNANTEKVETKVIGENNYRKHLFENFIKGKFPEKGYIIVLKENGETKIIWHIKDVEKCEGYLQLIQEQNPSPSILKFAR
ncbi:MAG: hypothetical protein L6266_01685 [Nanoarchaeota archaeon]|nr:hypothetical protein [Nanoarchaeota archaeon]